MRSEVQDGILRVDMSDGDDVAALIDIASVLNGNDAQLAFASLITAAGFLLLRSGIAPCEVAALIVRAGYSASVPLHAATECRKHLGWRTRVT